MRPKEFARVDVEDYCTAFLGALQKNPNFLNPDCGGAHPKIINRMFLSGIQTSHFRARTQKYDTENVKETFAAIKKVLPKYQESISMDMVPAIKSPPHISRQAEEFNINTSFCHVICCYCAIQSSVKLSEL